MRSKSNNAIPSPTMFEFAATRHGRLLGLCGICVLTACGVMAQQKVPKCQRFEGKTSQAALAYLKQEQTTLEPACIYDAILILEGDSYKPAIPTLLQYVDFKNPDAEIVHTARVGPTANFYPAADALGSFGEMVISAMQQVITSEDSNKVSRLNAASVYFWLKPKPSTFAFIAKAARDTGDRETGDALAGLAAKMVNHCEKTEQDDCKKALNPE
jgi:hypothetical protein